MKKPAQTQTVVRDTQSGRFIGRANDGTRIMRPSFRPQGVTVREIEQAVRAVRRRDEEAKAG
jgi:DNA-binding protein